MTEVDKCYRKHWRSLIEINISYASKITKLSAYIFILEIKLFSFNSVNNISKKIEF